MSRSQVALAWYSTGRPTPLIRPRPVSELNPEAAELCTARSDSEHVELDEARKLPRAQPMAPEHGQ